MTPQWRQLLEILECIHCKGSKGRIWAKADIILTAEPCEKHQRMLDRLGWAAR